MPKNAIYNSGGASILVYYYEDHDDLANKVIALANSGAVADITYNNVDRYLCQKHWLLLDRARVRCCLRLRRYLLTC